AVQPKIATHLAACSSELLYRSAVMAPGIAATWAQVSSTGSLYIPAVSDRYNVWGVPPVQIRDPVYNAQTAVDPFYFAAVMAALQAAFPPQITFDETQVPGILGFLGWSDHGPYIPKADLQTLGQVGFATAYIRQRSSGVFVKDNITAGAYSLDGQSINPFYQMSLRKQDDAVSRTAVAAAQQFRGSTAPGTTAMALEIQNAIDESLTALSWLTSHAVTCTPQSGNPFNYAVTINYVPEFPVLGIAITTTFSFS
ncbi:MAG: hypothetical protein KGL39_37975, partial [Patescibacteria group bacterium]|nr:hypothetical protein [Patescibacteria group bacterium]